MKGAAGIIVGARGTGKSTVARSMLKAIKPEARLVYDTNAEHKDLYPFPLEEFEDFTAKLNSVSNAFILIEESTIFLSNRGSNFDIKSVLVKARHRNNTIVFVFHSLRSIPRYIFELCNFIVLLKTSDDVATVEDRFDSPELTKAFTTIQAAKWQTSNGKRWSPNIVLHLMG